MAGMEWSTNSAGNHVNVFGSRELAKVERGRFDVLYGEFFPGRELEGDKPLVQMNHPRTFARDTTQLKGNWDQIFDVSLTMITSESERSKKFNDYGLDDYEPMKTSLPPWIAGEALPDRAVVSDTLAAVEEAGRPYVRLFEVLIGRGTDIAHENGENPSLVTNSTTGALERYTRVHSDWDYYLLNGFRTAPTAPHDNHYANWGTGHSSRTGVVAEALTEDALLDAIDARAVYASEDEQLELRLYADSRVPMGGKLVTRGSTATLTLLLDDEDYSGTFTVSVWSGAIGDTSAREVLRREGVTGGTWHTLTVELPSAGERFFYVEVTEPSPDRMAWSAPIWIERL